MSKQRNNEKFINKNKQDQMDEEKQPSPGQSNNNSPLNNTR